MPPRHPRPRRSGEDAGRRRPGQPEGAPRRRRRGQDGRDRPPRSRPRRRPVRRRRPRPSARRPRQEGSQRQKRGEKADEDQPTKAAAPAKARPRSAERLVVKPGEKPWTEARARRGPRRARRRPRRGCAPSSTSPSAELARPDARRRRRRRPRPGRRGRDQLRARPGDDRANNERENAGPDRARAGRASTTARYGVCESLRQPDRQDAVDGVPACHTVPDMQAARGTSLSSSDPDDPGRPARRSARRARCLPSSPSSPLVGVRRSTWSPRCSPSRSLTDRPPVARRRRPAAARPGPQPGRGLQHRHVVHRGAHLRRAGRRGRGRALARAGGSAAAAGPSALGLLLAGVARQPHRPAVPRAGAAARATSSTSSSCRTGRSSTSPTCASTSPPALIIVQALRGVRLDGTARPRERDPAASRDVTPAAPSTARRHRPRRAGRRARRRRDGPDVRALPHPGRRADRRRATCSVDGAAAGKSDRVDAGRRCSTSTIPAAVDPLAVVPEMVEGIRIIHDDDAIVVIDKPVGVAVHPSPGLDRARPSSATSPAAGFRIATSGAAERQGIVQRLDVGTSGVMVIAQVRARLLGAQERLPAPHGRQDLPRAGAGPPRPARAAPSTRRSAGTRRPTTSSR